MACALDEASCNGSEFHLAALSGDEEKVKQLIADGADVNAPVEDRSLNWGNTRTPLHYAAGAGHAEIVKLLLAAGANVYASDEPSGGDTVLKYAKNEEIADLLKGQGGEDGDEGGDEGGDDIPSRAET